MKRINLQLNQLVIVFSIIVLALVASSAIAASKDTSTEIKRGWLGVKLQEITPEAVQSFNLKEAKGALIVEVNEGGPASKGGLKAGDVVLEATGKPILDIHDLVKTISMSSPGSSILLKVWRDGSPVYKSVTLGELPYDSADTTKTSNRRKGEPPKLFGEFLQGKERIKSSAGKPGKEKIEKHRSAASLKPSIEIHRIEIKPSPVPAGSKFDLEVQYTVTDPAVKANKIPLQFGFSILRGTKILVEKKPVELESKNGSSMKRSEPLKASNKKGNYKIKIFLKYREKIAEDSVELKIE